MRPWALFVVVLVLFAAVAARADVFNMSGGATNLAMVTVGDPGNTQDTRYSGDFGPFGAVPYVFEIGKYEVTNAQYIEFLNKVARTDTYGLYDSRMGTTGPSGVTRSGSPGDYTYGVRDGNAKWLNRPVVFVSYWSACRFVNWLQHGQPTGAQDASTTEEGAYTLNGYTGNDGRTIVRNSGATWCIPSRDEWYKAAYYKGAGTNAGYWTYPTRSDSLPVAEAPPGHANSADYTSTPQPVGAPYWTTEAGAYQYSVGPYGTFDQAGNVSELCEEIYMYNNVPCRITLGGSWQNGAYPLSPQGFTTAWPDSGNGSAGFRVANVPEPSTFVLLGMGAVGLLGFVWRRRTRTA